MITIHTINSVGWVAITTAGQQGSAWVAENRRGNGQIFISHSATGTPASRFGLPLRYPNSNNGVMILGPDNANDIFYARCLKANSEIRICVDVI